MSDDNKKIEPPVRPEEPGTSPEESRESPACREETPAGEAREVCEAHEAHKEGTDRIQSEGRTSRAAKAVFAKCPECRARLARLEEYAKLPGAALLRERGRTEVWLLAFFAFLGLLVLINIFARPEHPHFGLDSWWGFWPVFGLAVGVAMVFIMKRVIQPLIVRKEDYYGDL